MQTTYPSGRIVDTTRDGVRRVEAIDTTLNGLAQNIVSNIQYRGDNQMLSCSFGNGTKDTRTYDLQGRLRSQQLNNTLNTPIDQRSYNYDKNSNITNIDTNLEDNAYLYDKLDRITSDTINAEIPNIFNYDLNDNRLNKTKQDLSLEDFFAYQADSNDKKSNRISVIETLKTGTIPIENTANRDLVYNDVGRLFQLIEDGSLKAEYIYNDQGQRTRKTVYQADGISVDHITIYHYSQNGSLITETTETGQLIKDYIWQEGMHPIAQIDNTQRTEQVLYLYADHLMTNRLATDQNQSIVWRWEGEAFGDTPAQELGGFSVNLRFPGQYFDGESGLFYNRMRYYDPSIGRYITSDPIGLGGGLNTYGYASQNSINFFDPLGLATYRYPPGNRYTDRRTGEAGCMKAIWVGGYIVGWVDCDVEDPCPTDGSGNGGSGTKSGTKSNSGPGTGADPDPIPDVDSDAGANGDDRKPWWELILPSDDKAKNLASAQCSLKSLLFLGGEEAIIIGLEETGHISSTIGKGLSRYGYGKTLYDQYMCLQLKQ